MKLHEDRYAFLTIINLIHEISGIRSDILEKDYYVSLLLRELAEKQSQLPAYFKGGTALYKAQKSMYFDVAKHIYDVSVMTELASIGELLKDPSYFQNMQKNYVFSEKDILPFEYVTQRWQDLRTTLLNLEK